MPQGRACGGIEGPRDGPSKAEVGRLAGQLSEARQHAARGLADAIQEEVAGLAFGHAQVLVDIRQSDSEGGVPVGTADGVPYATPSLGGESIRHFAFNETGIDSVEFLISLNPGEPPRPLARTASGGEASRLMLAIKTILSTADQIPILVFDEVDAGVGGRVGSVLGQKLWGLSKSHLVLCVTHLPQIACYADHHAKVTKLASHDRTVTSVEVLDGEARVTELSQMLGSDSGATRTNALEMLRQAKSWKESKRVPPDQRQLDLGGLLPPEPPDYQYYNDGSRRDVLDVRRAVRRLAWERMARFVAPLGILQPQLLNERAPAPSRDVAFGCRIVRPGPSPQTRR